MALTKTGTDGIKDDAVTLDKLAHGTSSQDGKFLRANNGAAPSFEAISNQTLMYPNGGTAVTTSTNDVVEINGKVNWDNDPNNTYGISFDAPTTLTKDSNYTLPEKPTGTGNFLTCDSNGDMSFTTDVSLISGQLTCHDLYLGRDASNNDPVIQPAAQANITLQCGSNSGGAFGTVVDNSGIQLGRSTQYTKIVAQADQTGQATWTLSLPVNAGSNAQVLTTNGSGITSWATPASGKVTNLILNGAMNLAQRGTSSTTSGYGSVDRFSVYFSNTDEAPTHAQADVASGTTPYTSGFRKALKITNGNQTSGAGANDFILARTVLEAQDIANSGWNYTSTSSYITLSFWVKSSVAQNFYGHIHTTDGSSYNYPFETGSLSADTWTKVTKTIAGNSNLQFDNDNAAGLSITFAAFFGTDYTASGATLNQWAGYASASLTPDNTTTWYTTNDATLEITGVQLEVGDTASDFPHESYNETLLKCKRYCHVLASGQYTLLGIGMQYYSGYIFVDSGPIDMRDTPTMVAKSGTSGSYVYETYFGNSPAYTHQISLDSKTKKDRAVINILGNNTRHSEAVRVAAHSVTLNNNEPFVYLDAEL